MAELVDPWWNVAAHNQAPDRAHRIGQEKKVTVYKLIAKDTVEEAILKLAQGILSESPAACERKICCRFWTEEACFARAKMVS